MLSKELLNIFLHNKPNGKTILLGKTLKSYNIKNNSNITELDCYLLYNSLSSLPKCLNDDCSNTVKLKSFSNGCTEYCCVKCMNTDKNIKHKIKQTKHDRFGNENYNNRDKATQTTLEKYGVVHISQSEHIKQKKIDTCLKNYGVEYPMQSPQIMQKSKSTCLEKYNHERPSQQDSIKQKIRKTKEINGTHEKSDKVIQKSKETRYKRYGNYGNNMEQNLKTRYKNFGHGNYFNSSYKEDIQRIWSSKTEYELQNINSKRRKTNLQKYGFENVMQTGLFTQSQYKYHTYTMPSGKIIRIQGYENRLIDELLLHNDECDIITNRKEMPIFMYMTEDGKQHRYFPDVYIPKTNTIYEVKSEYTLKSDLHINTLKFESVKNNGYTFILKVY